MQQAKDAMTPMMMSCVAELKKVAERLRNDAATESAARVMHWSSTGSAGKRVARAVATGGDDDVSDAHDECAAEERQWG